MVRVCPHAVSTCPCTANKDGSAAAGGGEDAQATEGGQKTPAGLQISYAVAEADQKLDQLVGSGVKRLGAGLAYVHRQGVQVYHEMLQSLPMHEHLHIPPAGALPAAPWQQAESHSLRPDMRMCGLLRPGASKAPGKAPARRAGKRRSPTRGPRAAALCICC